MVYLGLDYGTAHVGVALAMGSLAEPLTTFKTSLSLPQISDLIKKHHVAELVIGDAPAEYLEKLDNFGLPVHQVDETLSSHDARVSLLHTSQTNRRQKEHSVSAAIILQSYLDSIK